MPVVHALTFFQVISACSQYRLQLMFFPPLGETGLLPSSMKKAIHHGKHEAKIDPSLSFYRYYIVLSGVFRSELQ